MNDPVMERVAVPLVVCKVQPMVTVSRSGWTQSSAGDVGGQSGDGWKLDRCLDEA